MAAAVSRRSGDRAQTLLQLLVDNRMSLTGHIEEGGAQGGGVGREVGPDGDGSAMIRVVGTRTT